MTSERKTSQQAGRVYAQTWSTPERVAKHLKKFDKRIDNFDMVSLSAWRISGFHRVDAFGDLFVGHGS